MNNIPIFLESIRLLFAQNGIDIIDIYTRVKDKKFVHDYLGARTILKTPEDCLMAGKLVLENYKIVPGRYRDYISKPWDSGYRSIHIDLEFAGNVLELQIRTEEMDKTSKRLIEQYGNHYWQRPEYIR